MGGETVSIFKRKRGRREISLLSKENSHYPGDWKGGVSSIEEGNLVIFHPQRRTLRGAILEGKFHVIKREKERLSLTA